MRQTVADLPGGLAQDRQESLGRIDGADGLPQIHQVQRRDRHPIQENRHADRTRQPSVFARRIGFVHDGEARLSDGGEARSCVLRPTRQRVPGVRRPPGQGQRPLALRLVAEGEEGQSERRRQDRRPIARPALETEPSLGAAGMGDHHGVAIEDRDVRGPADHLPQALIAGEAASPTSRWNT